MTRPSPKDEQMMHDWIKNRLRELGLKQNDLAAALSVAHPRVTEIIKGTRRVRAEEAAIMANVLQMQVDEVLTRLVSTDQTGLASIREPIVNVPLISWVEAGKMAEVAEPYASGDAEDWFPVTSRSQTLIAVRVKGTSANRVAPPGSVAVIDYSDTDLVPGKLYAIRDTNGGGTIKRYKPNPDRFEPDSTEAHETIFLTEELHVIGRVTKAIHDL